MLPVKLPDEDSVSLALSASFGRLEIAIGTALAGMRPICIEGNIAGFKLDKKTSVKDAELTGVIAPALLAGFSKLAEHAPKNENDLLVDMTYKSKTHDIHETFLIPLRQDRLKQFMALAAKLISMQGKK